MGRTLFSLKQLLPRDLFWGFDVTRDTGYGQIWVLYCLTVWFVVHSTAVIFTGGVSHTNNQLICFSFLRKLG